MPRICPFVVYALVSDRNLDISTLVQQAMTHDAVVHKYVPHY